MESFVNDEPEAPSNSEPFRKMAERIDHNKDAGFGGACVFVPPPGAGEPIQILMLDSAADVAQFYSTVVTRIQIALDRMKDQANSPFGRR